MSTSSSTNESNNLLVQNQKYYFLDHSRAYFGEVLKCELSLPSLAAKASMIALPVIATLVALEALITLIAAPFTFIANCLCGTSKVNDDVNKIALKTPLPKETEEEHAFFQDELDLPSPITGENTQLIIKNNEEQNQEKYNYLSNTIIQQVFRTLNFQEQTRIPANLILLQFAINTTASDSTTQTLQISFVNYPQFFIANDDTLQIEAPLVDRNADAEIAVIDEEMDTDIDVEPAQTPVVVKLPAQKTFTSPPAKTVKDLVLGWFITPKDTSTRWSCISDHAAD